MKEGVAQRCFNVLYTIGVPTDEMDNSVRYVSHVIGIQKLVEHCAFRFVLDFLNHATMLVLLLPPRNHGFEFCEDSCRLRSALTIENFFKKSLSM